MGLQNLQSQMRQTLLGDGTDTDLLRYIRQQGEIFTPPDPPIFI